MSQNSGVFDVKPKNSGVIDFKPQNRDMTQPIQTEQFYSRVLGAGSPIGLLLCLTYKENITVMSSRT